MRIVSLLATLVLAGCDTADDVRFTEIPSTGEVTVMADVWADNWFSLSLGEDELIVDSVPITTERSFNAESFRFKTDIPMQLNFVVKDFRENDTGLEYIGARNQQMGDGGFIAQFRDADSGRLLAATNSAWQCLVVHRAPIEKSCEDSSNPMVGEGDCAFERREEPLGWRGLVFDDGGWPNAVEHSVAAVDPKHGYDAIDWDSGARLIWSEDLERDNTLLCRFTVSWPD